MKTPVDAFVLARLEKEGLIAVKAADRAILLRRLTVDLAGLPPAPGETDAFSIILVRMPTQMLSSLFSPARIKESGGNIG